MKTTIVTANSNPKSKHSIVMLSALAALCFLSSCQPNDTTELNYDGAVRFSSGIVAIPGTRATIDDATGNSLWELNDPIGIFMLKHNAAEVVDQARNVKYTAARAGASTNFSASPAGSIYYPLGETVKVDFLAYHPHTADLTDFVYPVDLSRQTPQTAIDLMTAANNNSGKGFSKADGRANMQVDFAFTHQLVKLVMNVSKHASVEGKITSVSINGMNTTARFDLAGSAGLTDIGTPAAITPCTITAEEKYEAILLPVDALGSAHSVTFTTDRNETFVWDMKEVVSFEAGKIYTYSVIVTKYGVSATGSINAWTLGGTGTVTAE